MTRTLDLVAAVLIASATATVVASPVFADDCTCRAPGKRVELGGTICLATPQGPRLARCVMDLNITSWKVLDVVCPLAMTPGDVAASRTAALTAPVPEPVGTTP